MKKLSIFILLLFIGSLQISLGQIKEIKGDTNSILYKTNTEIQKTLGLTDLKNAQNEFNFRLLCNGQVIEISKDSLIYKGTITNYIYHTKKANKEILSNKTILTSTQAKNIYNIIKKTKIADLPSDKDIKGWKQGTDGTTYIIEYANKKEYWFKDYWTPSAQDSIPESIIVWNFVKNISDTINLTKEYSKFENPLPRTGCYDTGAGLTTCYARYVSNVLCLGYSGASKLPLGFHAYYSATYFGDIKKNISICLDLDYNFDNNGFYHFNLKTSTWELFCHKESNVIDFMTYNYQNRSINKNGNRYNYENHQIEYGLNFDIISIGLGLDYISHKSNKVGGLLNAFKRFSKPKVCTTLTTSIFNKQINYKAEIFKSFFFYRRFPISMLTFGIAYEDFMNYKDIYFNTKVSF